MVIAQVTEMILKILFFIFIGALNTSHEFNRTDTVYYSDKGYVKFTSGVPLHTFSGESNHLTGMIDFKENIVDFYVDLNTLKTGIGKRDRDMYKTLNTSDHPFAEFTGSLTDTDFDLSKDSVTIVAEGTFTLNGMNRELSVDGSLMKENDNIILKARWEIPLSKYNIEPPGVLFYRVDEVQKVMIEVILEPA